MTTGQSSTNNQVGPVRSGSPDSRVTIQVAVKQQVTRRFPNKNREIQGVSWKDQRTVALDLHEV